MVREDAEPVESGLDVDAALRLEDGAGEQHRGDGQRQLLGFEKLRGSRLRRFGRAGGTYAVRLVRRAVAAQLGAAAGAVGVLPIGELGATGEWANR